MKVCLSIVIANYNYGKYIGEAIASVISQCLPPVFVDGRSVLPIRGGEGAVELIVCDAASVDQSVEVIQSVSKYIAWWCSEKDGGQSEAFNKGFAQARGGWLTWLNADELLCENVLVRFCRLISRNPSAQWVTGNYLGFDDRSKKILSATWGPHLTMPFVRGSHAPFSVFGPTSFWRRDIYLMVGPIDEKLHYAMDFDYWQRMIMAGVRPLRLNCFCWAFRVHEKSKTAGDQPESVVRKRDAEMAYIRQKTGYMFAFKYSNPFYLLWLLWRVMDGSLLIKPFVKFWCIGRSLNRYSSIGVLSPYRLNTYQFYMQWFVDALRCDGFRIKKDIRLPWTLKLLVGKLGLCFSTGAHRKRLIVCTGGRPEYFAWPWCYFYEIVPVVWDCWPKYWNDLANFVSRMRVRTIFITSSQVASYIKGRFPNVDVVWLPEGLNPKGYKNGGGLKKRRIDILELGRQYMPVHNDIVGHQFSRPISHSFQNGKKLLFPDFESLTSALAESKIVICYPRCDTHPEQAGHVETMTQRYWECMLSGALIAGRAPAELIKYCGYDPVIELGNQPAHQLEGVLSNIDSYQSLADRNFRFAQSHAGWINRMDIIKNHLGL